MNENDFQLEKMKIFGVDFDLIDYERVYAVIEHWRQTNRREYITITNPHSVLLFHRDKEMRRATSKSALTLPDGAGIVLGAKLLGYPHYGRITGPMLMLKLCDWGRQCGCRHYFFGGLPGVAEVLAKRLANKYPGLRVAGSYSPSQYPRSELQYSKEMVERINAARADIVWVGLGAPKQEKWIERHHGLIDAAAMIGVGAAFDFHSGRVKWAPPWVRKVGMEWAYRLMLEPRRMWRRNLDSPRFIFGVVRQRLTRTLR